MTRLKAIQPEQASGKLKELFNSIQTKLGMVPNMMRTMGNSPAVLNGYLSFSSALSQSSIGTKLAEQIALTVANVNACNYCNAAHSFIGEKLVGIDNETIAAAKKAKAIDKKTEAALIFSKKLVEKKGKINDKDVNTLKKAGFNETAISEIIAYVGFNIFTNYFNHAANVELDFPETELVTK